MRDSWRAECSRAARMTTDHDDRVVLDTWCGETHGVSRCIARLFHDGFVIVIAFPLVLAFWPLVSTVTGIK